MLEENSCCQYFLSHELNFSGWKGKTKLSFAFEAGWGDESMFTCGWNYTGCAFEATRKVTLSRNDPLFYGRRPFDRSVRSIFVLSSEPSTECYVGIFDCHLG
jgi:hypothetical protein